MFHEKQAVFEAHAQAAASGLEEPLFSGWRTHRMIVIPGGVSALKRDEFCRNIVKSVGQQREMARTCPHVLPPAGEPIIGDDCILIPHEPAVPLGLDALLNGRSAETVVWSVARALLGALAGAHQQSIVHGGVLSACVLADAKGGIRVTDFGIVPAYEAVCGIECRRGLACELPLGKKQACSGRWSISTSEDGPGCWIAPFLAHELLSERNRSTMRADLFSAGVLLSLMCTGLHPFGTDLNDPSPLCHWRIEPLSPGSASGLRPNGASADDRGSRDLNELVQSLLRLEPAERLKPERRFQELLQERGGTGVLQRIGTLEIIARGGKRLVDLFDETSITIGRSGSAEVRVAEDRWLSRLHARISVRGGVPRIEDLGSRHGICAAHGPLTGPAALVDQMTVRAGSSCLRFHAESRTSNALDQRCGPERVFGSTQGVASRRASFSAS